MPRFSWLHLVGLEQIAADRWPNIREALVRDLQQIHEKTGDWDVVMYVGASAGQPGGIDRDMGLRRLSGLLAEPMFARQPSVVWLPGSQDITHRRGPAAKAARAWDVDSELRDEEFWAPGSPYLTDVTAAHAIPDMSPFRGAGEVRRGVLPGDAA